MTFFENIPWEKIATHLREQADRTSGFEGALIGAGLGVVTTMATAKAVSRKVSVPVLLTGVAVGIAYGAADKKLIAEL